MEERRRRGRARARLKAHADAVAVADGEGGDRKEAVAEGELGEVDGGSGTEDSMKELGHLCVGRVDEFEEEGVSLESKADDFVGLLVDRDQLEGRDGVAVCAMPHSKADRHVLDHLLVHLQLGLLQTFSGPKSEGTTEEGIADTVSLLDAKIDDHLPA